MMSKESMNWRVAGKHRFVRHCSSAVAVAAFLAICSNAGAFDIDTGNEDVKLSWNNTLRYTYGLRTSSQNQAFLKNINADDGNRNFKQGSTVTNRIDLLSELTTVYKNDYGIRLSGAGWYDDAYARGLDNNSLSTSNHFNSTGQQAYGLSGKTKDAFFKHLFKS